MYVSMFSTKPDLKIIGKNTLRVSRRPSLVSWFLLFVSVIVSFEIFGRLTGSACLTIISVLGEILFGIEALSEDWSELRFERAERRATITRSTWKERLRLVNTRKESIEMRLDEKCHVGASRSVGLFVLCRDGKIITLDTRGFDRREIINCRLEISRFLTDNNTTLKNRSNSDKPEGFLSTSNLYFTSGFQNPTKKRFFDRSVSSRVNDPASQNFTRTISDPETLTFPLPQGAKLLEDFRL